MFDVNASLIRFWEKEFDIIKPKKNKKGNRLFTKEDIDNFHIIYHLVKDYNLVVNVFRARITPEEEGYLVLDVTGTQRDIDKAMELGFVDSVHADPGEAAADADLVVPVPDGGSAAALAPTARATSSRCACCGSTRRARRSRVSFRRRLVAVALSALSIKPTNWPRRSNRM